MATIDESAHQAPPEPTDVPAVLKAIVRMVALPAIGAALGFVLLVKVVLPATGVGTVERIVELGRHLAQPVEPLPLVAFLGNSITREGVDTRLVAAAAPADWHAQNLAISACGLNELRVIMPRMLAAKPTAVAFGLRPEDMGRLDDFDLDKAFAYALGGFVTSWPADWTRADLPGVGPSIYEALRSTRFEQQLHFRTAPLNVFNQEVRLRFRSGLRRAAPDDWTEPYEMNFSVHDERLDRHQETIVHDMESRLGTGEQTGTELVELLTKEIHDAGVLPILIILPMHPRLREPMAQPTAALRQLVARVAAEQQALVIDALDVLAADEYADIVHPNAAGREVYSRFLGQHLPATTSPQP